MKGELGSFCYISYVLWFVFDCLFIAALWSPVEKGLTSWLSCAKCFLVFLALSHTKAEVALRPPVFFN